MRVSWIYAPQLFKWKRIVDPIPPLRGNKIIAFGWVFLMIYLEWQ